MTTRIGERGRARWLRAALAIWVLASSLVVTAPPDRSDAAPLGQRAGASDQDPCRAPAPPLLQQYDDVLNGFGFRYPDGWIWRPRSDALPGTRSELIWFGPNYTAARSSPECITSLRLSMHFLLNDSSLEEMRDATAMSETGALLTRQIQAEVAATPTPGLGPLPRIPETKVSGFWANGRRQLWGAERLTLPSGHEYYREVGRGPVQDLELRERSGNIVRYVIGVSPRTMLEVVGEATPAEFETYYARLYDQIVQSLRIRDQVSPHPGPIGESREPGTCQALIFVNDLKVRDRSRGRGTDEQQPFLERSAVAEQVQLRGWALPVNADAASVPGAGSAEEGCGGPIGRMALFLDPPGAGADNAVHDVSVYGLTYPAPPPLDGLDPDGAGYFLSWTIPNDTYGQRVVYIAAEMPDGRWSWVTRQINVAPPLSVAIDVVPPQVDIGEPVRVVMTVQNNTSSRIEDVRPILMPMGGPGVVLLRSGPVRQDCDLRATPAARLPAATTTGTAPAPTVNAPVALQPYGSPTGSCVWFYWEFTALRSGPLSFSGTAEGRRVEAVGESAGVRLLSSREAGSGPLLGQVQIPAASGDQVSAPVTTATDVQVRPAILEFQRANVVPDFEDPRRVVVFVPVRNTGGADLYNVQIALDVRGVRALPSPLTVSGDRVAETAFLREGRTCPTGLGTQLIQRLESRLQPGDAVPLLRRDECVAFVRAFEVSADESLTQPFFVEAKVQGTTPQSGTQDVGGGVLPVVYPEASTQWGPFTVDLLQDLVPVRLRRPGTEVSTVDIAVGTPTPSTALPGVTTGGSRGGPGGGSTGGDTGGAGGGGTGGGGQSPRLTDPDPLLGVLPQAQPSPPTGPIPGVPGPGAPPAPAPGPSGGATPTARGRADESGQLVVRLDARPTSSQDAIVFRIGDTVRVTMEVRNETGLPLRNVRPSDLSINGQRPTDVFALPTAVPVVQIPGAVPSGGGVAPPALQPPPPPPGGEVTFCVIELPGAVGGVVNQIRQLRGPDPVVVDRLGPGQTATFTWEFLVQQYRGQSPQMIFEGSASGEFAGDLVVSDQSRSAPVEHAIGCIFVDMTASPANVQPGSIIEVSMRAHQNQLFFPSRSYTDVFPTQLQMLVDPARGRENVDVSLQLLSGPANEITGGPIDLNYNEVTYFRWRYLVNGHGCFRLRGQLGARPLRSTASSFFSNNVETNQVCTPVGSPRR